MSSRFAMWLGAAALVGTLGCTKVLPPLTPPETGGPAWRELVSKHVILRTDREEQEANDALVDLERTFVALHDVAFAQVNVEGSRILVVHFDRQRDFDMFAPSDVAGVFKWQLPNDLEPEPTMLVWGKLDAPARGTLQHELAHLFIHASAGGLPVWLNEGLAQYYETLAVEEGSAFIGRPLLKLRAWPKTEWGEERTGAFMTTDVPIGAVPAVKDLIAMDAGKFYVWTDLGRQPQMEEERAQMTNYLGAYGLVHMLLHQPEYQPKYDALMEEIAKGTAADSAWAQVFAKDDPGKLETDYRKHLLNRYETMVLKTAYTHPNVAVEHVRTMDAAEVHLLWARLRPWRGATLAAAETDMEQARKLGGATAEVRYWSGVMRARKEDLAGAKADFDAAIAAKPDEPRYAHAAAELCVLLARAKPDDAEAAKNEKEAMDRLGKVARSGTELNMVASYRVRQARWDDALALAQRAVKADPGCWQCFSTLGAVHFAKKQYTDAARAQQIALSLLPDGTSDPAEEARLKLYVEAVRKPPADNPAPPP